MHHSLEKSRIQETAIPWLGRQGRREVITDYLGSAHCGVSASLTDERKLLEATISGLEPLTVLRPSDSAETVNLQVPARLAGQLDFIQDE
jgi:hypothetical protein